MFYQNSNFDVLEFDNFKKFVTFGKHLHQTIQIHIYYYCYVFIYLNKLAPEFFCYVRYIIKFFVTRILKILLYIISNS